MIITQLVNIKPGKVKKRYIDLGYKPNKDGTFDVRPQDLAPCSHAKIIVQCDEPDCNNTKEISYNSYCLTVKKNGYYRCFQCGNKAKKKIFLQKYGYDNPAKHPDIKEKMFRTNLKKYGVRYQFDRDDFDEIKKKTCLEKYGVEHQLQSEEIQNKIKQTNLERFGVEYVLQFDEIKDRVKQTNIERYGFENPLSSPEIRKKVDATCKERYGGNPQQCNEIKEKSKQTCIDKYGVDNVFKSEIFQEKIKESMLQKYGVEHPIQNEQIREKIINTNMEKYGYPYTLMSPDIIKKIENTCMVRYGSRSSLGSYDVYHKAKLTRYYNNTITVSTQQVYLNNLYNGILNFPIGIYNADILIDDYIDIEYDGGGHRLTVKLGDKTNEEFDHLEVIRNTTVKRADYKTMRIISAHDLLPSDTILLQMLDDAKQYFSDYPEHSWINYDIDNSLVKNAEHKDGVPYFYGELRKIKKTDVESA